MFFGPSTLVSRSMQRFGFAYRRVVKALREVDSVLVGAGFTDLTGCPDTWHGAVLDVLFLRPGTLFQGRWRSAAFSDPFPIRKYAGPSLILLTPRKFPDSACAPIRYRYSSRFHRLSAPRMPFLGRGN